MATKFKIHSKIQGSKILVIHVMINTTCLCVGVPGWKIQFSYIFSYSLMQVMTMSRRTGSYCSVDSFKILISYFNISIFCGMHIFHSVFTSVTISAGLLF